MGYKLNYYINKYLPERGKQGGYYTMKKIVKNVGILSLATLGAISVASCKKDDVVGETHASYDKVVSVSAEGTRHTYSNASYAERQKILGLLEKYAVDNNLTGMTLFGDGSYIAYNDRIKSPTEWNYIPGYGFGILAEGTITADLASETKAEWKRYYHTYEADIPSTLNYMNAKESTVGELADLLNGSYFGTQIDENNNTKYRWFGNLAEDASTVKNGLLTPVNEDSDGKATEYKFKVKLGADATYTTLSSNSSIAAFNGREVAKDDYLTPYKLLFSQKIGYARAAETFGSSSALKGAQEYYNKTKDATTWEQMNQAWNDTLGKYIFFDDEGYLHITFAVSKTPFYAMYTANSSMYAPVPADYITALGTAAGYDNAADAAKVWGNQTDSGHGNLTPVDTVLSTGAYAVETWNTSSFTFKRTGRVIGNNLYKMEGVHYKIFSASKNDENAAYDQFTAGTFDSAGVPKAYLDKEKSKPYVHQTTDSSTFKINYNTCDAAEWEALFGENGSITQTPKSQYWALKPAMSNDAFVKGLGFSIDRKTFADTYGRSATGNYFGNGYFSDPENGVIYNTTEDHKKAVSEVINDDTDAYGYSLTKAQSYFKTAAEELITSGAYAKGDTINIEIAWQTEAQSSGQGATLKKMLEDAFNKSEANTEYGLTLNINNYACAVWSDVYYKKMMVGQFDLAFGSINGNTLDPLNFLEVLKSDNTSGFTLNWGVDTNVVSSNMIYDGKAWSFDALWQAADSSALVKNGQKVNYVDSKLSKSLYNEDGTRSTVIKYAAFNDGAYRATFLNEDGSVKNDYVSVSYVDGEGNQVDLASSDVNMKFSNGQIAFDLSKEVEDAAVQIIVKIHFDIEKYDATTQKWVVAEEGKSEAANTISINTRA